MSNWKELCELADKKTQSKVMYAGANDNRQANIIFDREENYSNEFITRDCGVYGPDEPDADFIIAVWNSFDKLRAVVEAAKNLAEVVQITHSESIWSHEEEQLIKALGAIDDKAE